MAAKRKLLPASCTIECAGFRAMRANRCGEFGFLESADGREIYFHRNSVLDNAFSQLVSGSRVTFAEEMGEKGPQASTLKLLRKHKLR